MTSLFRRFGGRTPYLLTALAVAGALCIDSPYNPIRMAGGCNGQRISQVGGVRIDASGAVERLQVDELNQLRKQWEAALGKADADMQKPSALRKVSLRKLEAALEAHLMAGTPIPDELKLLAGLQKIQYVFVYPEERDIVLAGFGEGWKMTNRGDVVGLTTGKPVLNLDDLLVALRSADEAARGGITCSIDPTPEGMQRLQAHVATLGAVSDPQAVGRGIEQALGPQMVTVGGVPATTHFAHVLVAADYRMKRLGMALDSSPVPGLVSYLQLAPTGKDGLQAVAPRWWLVPNYQPVVVDPDGLAYELRAGSVKCLTEDTIFAAGGNKSGSGGSSPAAQRWADMMTTKYDALAAKEPVFAELQNVMDLAIVAALIKQENLARKAGHALPLLLDVKQLPNDQLEAVKQTDSVVSVVAKGGRWIMSASGGVQIDSWTAARNRETSPAVAAARDQAQPQANRWWWD
jgi:hypothetical protein